MRPSQLSPRWPLPSQKLVPKEARAPSTGCFPAGVWLGVLLNKGVVLVFPVFLFGGGH